LTCPGKSFGPYFNGTVRVRDDLLFLPLSVRKSTVFAVWTDLYHEKVEDEFIAKAFDIIDRCQEHTFLIITKRAKRCADWHREAAYCDFPNAWHLFTVEDQQRADERIPYLLEVPGNKGLLCEPLLSPLDLSAYMGKTVVIPGDRAEPYNMGIGCVLAGGETGKKARSAHPDWFRDLRDQSEKAEIPFFFKGWGSNPHIDAYRSVPFVNAAMHGRDKGRILDGYLHNYLPWRKP
jgi:protein gp37